MEVYKGIYNKGVVKLSEPYPSLPREEVIVIFPEKEKKILKIRGLFKDKNVNFSNIEKELKKLSRNSEKHIVKELDHYAR